MLARGILGSGWTRGVSFWPFPNSSGWWWLISSVFLTRISCPKTTHANGYYGAWPETVSISVLPLATPIIIIANTYDLSVQCQAPCKVLSMPCLMFHSRESFGKESNLSPGGTQAACLQNPHSKPLSCTASSKHTCPCLHALIHSFILLQQVCDWAPLSNVPEYWFPFSIQADQAHPKPLDSQDKQITLPERTGVLQVFAFRSLSILRQRKWGQVGGARKEWV